MKISNISKQFKRLMINYKNKLILLQKNKRKLINMNNNWNVINFLIIFYDISIKRRNGIRKIK